MTDSDQTKQVASMETPPVSEGPPAEPSRAVVVQDAGAPNGNSESAIVIALDERRRLLDFLEEMRREQTAERHQWFSLIERLSGDQRAEQSWPLRIWHWLIADAPEPSRSSEAKPSRLLPRPASSKEGT
jgi:hypothetical protein